MTYKTPSACYKKAPCRHETPTERRFRQYDQVPMGQRMFTLPRLHALGCLREGITINKDLVPGSAKFVQEVTKR